MSNKKKYFNLINIQRIFFQEIIYILTEYYYKIDANKMDLLISTNEGTHILCIMQQINVMKFYNQDP